METGTGGLISADAANRRTPMAAPIPVVAAAPTTGSAMPHDRAFA